MFEVFGQAERTGLGFRGRGFKGQGGLRSMYLDCVATTSNNIQSLFLRVLLYNLETWHHICQNHILVVKALMLYTKSR